jgi:outer membrane protein TolC
MELEAARTKMEALKTEGEIADTEGAMAELIGLHAGTMAKLPEKPLPDLPAAAPTLDELRAKLLPANLTLARLRLAYDVAERELRLEIAKQYPDFRFGPSFANETGESKHVLGLTLGIELPAFDRNQQAIATADKRRDEVRVRYEAAANRVLARLERAWRALQLAQQKRELLRNVLEPKAKANIEFARKALESGVTDTLRFLETERGQRSVLVEAVEVELAVREAWVELEQTVGCALFRFPDEPEGAPGEASQPEEARRE